MSRRAAVAATNPLAAQAGLDLVHGGGTAVDAAIAAMTVSFATEPGIVSPMAGAYVAVWPADGAPVVVDGNVEMPGRGMPSEAFGRGVREIHTDYGGGITVGAGHGSVATPGAFAAFELAHERYGGAPWRELMAPAIRALRTGFPVGAAAASYLQLVHDSLFGWDEQTRAAVTGPGGGPARAGDLLVLPDLADSLEQVASQGATVLYSGDLGAALVADMRDRGGLITRDDLTAYEAVIRPALTSTFGDWTVATNPPPSIGGPVLTALLRLLADRPGGAADARALIEVQRAVLGYRISTIDPAPDLAVAGRELLDTIEAHGLAGLPTSASTAHVSVMGSDGLACAITASAGYGSGATVPGTGLMLNNSLGEPELNRRGLHALSPGTRLASNMAPTVAAHRDGERLAIGTPGADRITTALMQVLGRHCQGGEGLQEAIDAPRLHVHHLPDGSVRVEYEADPGLAAQVEASGLPGVEHDRHAMFFGGVGAAVTSSDGALAAAADPRREAATALG
jgi:gamma-glutamyltranspeptidase/glutathione hydrolase